MHLLRHERYKSTPQRPSHSSLSRLVDIPFFLYISHTPCAVVVLSRKFLEPLTRVLALSSRLISKLKASKHLSTRSCQLTQQHARIARPNHNPSLNRFQVSPPFAFGHSIFNVHPYFLHPSHLRMFNITILHYSRVQSFSSGSTHHPVVVRDSGDGPIPACWESGQLFQPRPFSRVLWTSVLLGDCVCQSSVRKSPEFPKTFT
jgi:hypothetical protein